MANIIDQLEISGIVYDVQDASAQAALPGKQDTLVSGVNIKTINNESLLGSGNIEIQGGTGDAYTKAETDALLANKADTSAVTNAINAATSGKANSSDVYLKSETSSSTEINNALQAKADASTTYSKTEVDNAINAATSGKADTSTVTSAVTEFSAALGNEIQRAQEAEQVLSGAVDTKANSSDVYLKSETSSSTQINDALQAKADTATTYSKSEVDTAINAATSGKADTSAVTAAINAAVSRKADADDVYTKTETDTLLNNKADVSAVTGEVNRAQAAEQALSGAIDGKQATLVSGTNIKTINNESLLGSGNITIQGGGANVVELTQAEYDALAVKDPDTFYVITDATEIDANNFYLKTQTSSSTQIAAALQTKADASTTSSATQISDALAGKQNTLTAGTGIDITADVISVTGGGGGSSYTAGRGINISNDQISLDVPVYKTDRIGSSVVVGLDNVASVQGATDCLVGGYYCGIENADPSAKYGSVAMGMQVTTKNGAEAALGKHNLPTSASTTFGDSGNTLFTVGNGQAFSAKHNAFEVRANGDVYIPDTNNTTYQNYYEKPMLKLQDVLADKQDTLIPGAGIDITNNVISVTGGGGGGTTYTGVSGISITQDNEIYYKGIYKTFLTNNTDDNYAVYWFKGGYTKIWIDGNSPVGRMNYLRSQFSFGANNMHSSIIGVAMGQENDVYGYLSSAFGNSNIARNSAEHSIGQYNNSVSASTTFGDSGNTLFSVGNGTAGNARHNAFEIRQNGDIYITSGGTDIKLQDNLGGGSVTIDSALDSGSTNAVANSAITAGINDAITSVTAEFTNVYTALAGKQPMLTAGTGIDITDNVISVTGGGGGTIDASLDSGSTNPVANSGITSVLSRYYYARKINNSQYNSPFGTASSDGCAGFNLQFANIANPNDSVSSILWLSKINDKNIFSTSTKTPSSNSFNFNLVETSAITTSLSSSSTDAQVPSAKAVYDAIGDIETLLSQI